MAWKLIEPVLQVINRLLDWFDKINWEKDREERQEKRDSAKADPGSAFADHFGGVLADKADDAEATSKTDSGNTNKPNGS